MAGLSTNELQNILGRAKRLCNTQGDKLVTAHSDQSQFSRKLDESYDVPSVEEFDDAEKWDSLYSASVDEQYERSALPENIKKSLRENPIEAKRQVSVTEGLDLPTRERVTVASQRRDAVNENVMPRSAGAGVVDYSLIKTIVSECVREALANQQINENTLSQIHIKNSTISVVDGKGNVYRAKLQKIGNTSDQ